MQKVNKFKPLRATIHQLFVHANSGMFRMAIYTHEDELGNKIFSPFGRYYPDYWDASKALTELASGMQELNEIVGGSHGNS